MLVLRYTDRPGVVGTIGGVLGGAGINIAGMQVARAAEGGEALGVLTVDQAAPTGVLDDIAARWAPARAASSTSPSRHGSRPASPRTGRARGSWAGSSRENVRGAAHGHGVISTSLCRAPSSSAAAAGTDRSAPAAGTPRVPTRPNTTGSRNHGRALGLIRIG